MSDVFLKTGLDALFEGISKNDSDNKAVEKYIYLPIGNLVPGHMQPRKNFPEKTLQELGDSILSQGLLQPLLVRKVSDNKYEIIAGERRWRAAQLAGINNIPVIIKNIANEEALEYGLIENIQRENLNPIEEAQAYSRLINEFSLTHEEISKKVGKSRAVITNSLRLLKLINEVQQYIIDKKISVGHARLLISLPESIQEEVALKVIKHKLNVRSTEKLIKKIKEENESEPLIEQKPNLALDIWRTQLAEYLPFTSNIKFTKGGVGKIQITVRSSEEMNDLILYMKKIHEKK